jgi:hypothetical protein
MSKSDGKFYPSAYVESNGSRVDWFHPIDSLPRPVVATLGKKKVVDDSDVVEFYHKVVDDLIAKFGGAVAPKQVTTPVESDPIHKVAVTKKQSPIESARLKFEEADASSPSFDVNDDDLPF